MSIRFPCDNPECAKVLTVPDGSEGKKVACPACKTESTVPSAEELKGKQLFQTLGDHKLIRKIGQGGMGVVYEAVQTSLDRRVALKVLAKRLTDKPVFLERFQREARSAAALNHPHIIQVYDIGEDQGYHYFTMELVEGEDLMQRVKRAGRVPLKDAIEFTTCVARALQYAHGKSIIHRDIKPDNIMVNEDRVVKLADMGLAKSVKEDAGVTQTNTGIGTPYFMSPEQGRDATSVDHRSDIYSLGITLLFLVTGKYPFDGDTPLSIMMAHTERPLPTGHDLGTDLPEGVDAVIQKMAAKSPDDRYQDYAELIGDLERLAQGKRPLILSAESVQKARQSRLTAAQVRSRIHGRKRKNVAVALAVGALAAGVAVLAVYLLRPPPAPSPSSDPSPPVAHPSPADPKPTSSTSVKPNKPAPDEATRIAALIQEAADYAQGNPEDLRGVVERYRNALKEARDPKQVAGLKEALSRWQTQWEAQAEARFTEFRGRSQAALQDHRYVEAFALWNQFPESFRTDLTAKKVEREQQRFLEGDGSLADLIDSRMKAIFPGGQGNTSPDQAQQVAQLRTQIELALRLVKDRIRQSGQFASSEWKSQERRLEGLREDLGTQLKVDQAAKSQVSAQAFDALRESLTRRLKESKYDEAIALVRGDETGLDAVTRKRLETDIRLLQNLIRRAQGNLDKLVGRSIRFSGQMVDVASIRDGQLVVKSGGVEMAVGTDRLDVEEILRLGTGDGTAEATPAHLKAIHQFFLGSPAQARLAFASARAEGSDFTLYEESILRTEDREKMEKADAAAKRLINEGRQASRQGKDDRLAAILQQLAQECSATPAYAAAAEEIAKWQSEVLVAQTSVGQWAQTNGNEYHTRRSRFAGPAKPFLRWKTRVCGSAGHPVISPRGLIHVSGFGLQAIEPKTGKEQWSFLPADAQANFSTAVVDREGTVFVTNTDGRLYAVDRQGKQAWSMVLSPGFPYGAPTPALGPDGVIYVRGAQMGSDTTLVAISPRDGARKWSIPIRGPLGLPTSGLGPDILLGGWKLLYISPDGNVSQEFPLGSDGRPLSVGCNGILYTPAQQSVKAVTRDGRTEWTFAVPPRVRGDGAPRTNLRPLAVGSDGTLFVSTNEGVLHAIGPGGQEKWKYQAPNRVGAPTLGADGTVYLTCNDNSIYAVSPDGQEKWRLALDAGNLAGPAIGPDGTLYVAAEEGILFAIGSKGR